MLRQEFLDCFHNGTLCPDCNLMCHYHKPYDRPQKPSPKETLGPFINKHSLDQINRAIGPSYHLASFEHPEYYRDGLIVEMCITPSYYAGVPHEGQSPIFMQYTSQIDTHPETVTKTKQVHDGEETYYVKEPVYETVTKYREETYKERIPGPKAGPVRYNTSTRVYTNWDNRSKSYQNYHDVESYETKWENLPVKYEEKTKKVPYTERVLTGYKDVPKKRPRYRYVTENKTEDRSAYRSIPIFYYLIPQNKPCKKCTCSRCTSIWTCLWNYFNSP